MVVYGQRLDPFGAALPAKQGDDVSTIASLCTARLDYPPELALHTASSGRVEGLDALYLHLERDGRTVGLGEMRENIAYLTGVPADIARAQLLKVLALIDFARDPEDLLVELSALTQNHPSFVSALLDCTLHDCASRAADVPLVNRLGGAHRAAMPSNPSCSTKAPQPWLTSIGLSPSVASCKRI